MGDLGAAVNVRAEIAALVTQADADATERLRPPSRNAPSPPYSDE